VSSRRSARWESGLGAAHPQRQMVSNGMDRARGHLVPDQRIHIIRRGGPTQVQCLGRGRTISRLEHETPRVKSQPDVSASRTRRARSPVAMSSAGVTPRQAVVDLGEVGVVPAAMELKPRPHAIVVFTDGETPWPDAKPQVPLVICLVGAGAAASADRVPE